ncbi:MAG TPA: hypothetical protein VFT42_07290 [Solirubrobacteraceae bacterium]|nr:hypothetical protein [Solirubrobacteraceae bacterium]
MSDSRSEPEHDTRSARLDDLGAASFPASDPPQAWTWECATTAVPDEQAPAEDPARPIRR